ncbi:glycine/betaine ABC transporter substrate-binding protein [Streptomyces durbertensis]|uniref:Glycine/betaine ABC transporter substrate-binding protein n=1 Tax=Streptomyces durbertensis TaxID=2448886 RepID=A0ABR6EMR1_9ACTN|nr:glycine betaine ABC transporter substrate-binding protein [Streptomyces durbertensis]MBB1246621.1 glycine/betaine ABC transporter substrate-binding protein [Streptomyces durbertensis]
MHHKRIRTSLTVAAGLTGVLALSACGAADTGNAKGGADKVTLAMPSWVGAEANVAVAAKLLEDELDVRTSIKTIDESLAFDALHRGQADAILEDWGGAPKKVEQYVDKRKTVVSGGGLGVEGHIGWFVPKYYADKNPDVLDFKNLNKFKDDFKTPESGDKGQFIGAAPSYTSYDKHLIKNHKLDYKILPTGSEAAQLKEIQRLYKAKKPFLTYWWDPQWMNADIEMVEVKLPEYTEGCNKPETETKCGYDTNMLQKYLNADFAENGGKAAEFLKNFEWSTEDQNAVAKMIAGDKMKRDEAAAKWIADNKSTWEKWIPKD